MPDFEIEIVPEKFMALKKMRRKERRKYLEERLHRLESYLEVKRIIDLRDKLIETREKIALMKREIAELDEFCTKAQKDQEKMSQWISLLKSENEELLKKLREENEGNS